MKNIGFLLIVFLLGYSVMAQELNCRFRIQTPNMQSVDASVFKTLEADVNQFLNNQIWTSDRFGEQEKIDCNIVLVITNEFSQTRFGGELTVQADRPVFNSNYLSPIFIHKDSDVQFEYSQFSALEFDENAFMSNLTSVLGFYVYTIIGIHYDSFQRMGGTPYFTKAQNIVNVAANNNNSHTGWKPTEGLRNRYWINENYMNSKYNDIREATYIYHRNGLDEMYSDPNNARKMILSAVKKVEGVFNISQSNFLVKIFTTSKTEELKNIFGDMSVPGKEKTDIMSSITRIDPSAARLIQDMNKMGVNKAPTVPMDNGMNSRVPADNGINNRVPVKGN